MKQTHDDILYIQWVQKLVLDKIIWIRKYLRELGYSQSEVQVFFQTHIFEENSNTTLFQQINRMATVSQFQLVLCVLDQIYSQIQYQQKRDAKQFIALQKFPIETNKKPLKNKEKKQIKGQQSQLIENQQKCDSLNIFSKITAKPLQSNVFQSILNFGNEFKQQKIENLQQKIIEMELLSKMLRMDKNWDSLSEEDQNGKHWFSEMKELC